MAQQLWLLRHGEAEPHGARPDPERRLTPRGEAQARAAGAALAALELRFALVLCSPRVRARDTARPVCEALGCEAIEHEPLSGGFGREDALAALAGIGGGERLLLVGHEPDLSQLIHDLGGGRVAMRKGGLAGLRISRGAGDLIALLRPAELGRIAGEQPAS